MMKFNGYTKGINLGGWLSQCGEENYNEEHYRSFITESDVRLISSWNQDHIRLPIDYNVVQNEDGSFIESGFVHIDNCIKWCKANGLRLIIDVHKTAGYSFDSDNEILFFDDESMQEHFIELWLELSRRYGSMYDDITFELLNEVTDVKYSKKWNEIARRTIIAIREIAPQIKIIIGGIENNSIMGLSLLDEPYDSNMVFTFHFYSPTIFTHQRAYWVKEMPDDYTAVYPEIIENYYRDSVAFFGNKYDPEYELCDMKSRIDHTYFEQMFSKAVEISEKYNVPIYCGEYGVIDRVDTESKKHWHEDIKTALENCGIGHAVWNYKAKDFGITDPPNSEIMQIMIP